MLFDKNGEVLSYDETDMFCEELAFSDEYTAYCRYLNRLESRGRKAEKTGDKCGKSEHGRDKLK